MSDYYYSVRNFHSDFGHPINVHSVPLQLQMARVAFLLEELMEFGEANDLEAQVDALIDFAYFAVGNMVICGRYDALDHGNPGMTPNIPLREYEREAWMSAMRRNLSLMLVADDVSQFGSLSVYAARQALKMIAAMGLDPWPVFAEVHRANMDKLSADGRPLYHPVTGKVVKPDGWRPPNLAPIIRSQLEGV